jgi:hypothetical protein
LRSHRDGKLRAGKQSGRCGKRDWLVEQHLAPADSTPEEMLEAKQKREQADISLQLAVGGAFDPKVLHRILAIWITRHSLEFTRVQDLELQGAFFYCRKEATLVGDTWMAKLSAELSDKLNARVNAELEVGPAFSSEHTLTSS